MSLSEIKDILDGVNMLKGLHLESDEGILLQEEVTLLDSPDIARSCLIFIKNTKI